MTQGTLTATQKRKPKNDKEPIELIVDGKVNVNKLLDAAFNKGYFMKVDVNSTGALSETHVVLYPPRADWAMARAISLEEQRSERV